MTRAYFRERLKEIAYRRAALEAKRRAVDAVTIVGGASLPLGAAALAAAADGDGVGLGVAAASSSLTSRGTGSPPIVNDTLSMGSFGSRSAALRCELPPAEAYVPETTHGSRLTGLLVAVAALALVAALPPRYWWWPFAAESPAQLWTTLLAPVTS